MPNTTMIALQQLHCIITPEATIALTMINILQSDLAQSIISGAIGGLIVYFIQDFREKRRKEKERLEKQKEQLEQLIVGKKDLKILAQDFLYQYEPHKITMEKIHEEFGHPHRIEFYDENKTLYVFEFQNAKVQFIEDKADKTVISITVFSKLMPSHPINCRLSFEEDDKILGEATISDTIINDHFKFETANTTFLSETIIGCSNNYRQTKHLSYFYQIDEQFKSLEETKGQIIRQVCVTQVSSIYSFFTYYDAFYN